LPERTCKGCGKKTSKKYLLRFVIDKEKKLHPDPYQVLPGRGAYSCQNKSCLKRFEKIIKKTGKFFRIQSIDLDG
jgi:uncharacterized protein